MAKKQLQHLPPVDTNGVGYAKFGTATWAVICGFSWLFQGFLAGTALAELPQISTAGFVLGLIGLNHVTRRARRITQRQD